MSKLVCLKCGEIYENKSTTKIKLHKKSNWYFCPKSSCHGKMVKLDENMIAPVLLLNQHKIETTFCCGGHINEVVFDPYLSINCSNSKKLGRIVRNFLLHKTSMENFVKDKISVENQEYTNNMGWYIEEFVKPMNPDYNLDSYLRTDLIHLSQLDESVIILRASPVPFVLSSSGKEQFKSIITNNYKIAKRIIILSSHLSSPEIRQEKRKLLSLYNKNIKRFQRLEVLADQEFLKLPLMIQQLIINQLNNQLLTLINELCNYIDNNPVNDVPENYKYQKFEMYDSELTEEDIKQIEEETKNVH